MLIMLKKIGMGAVTLLVLGLAVFFLYVVKTPHYSLYLINKAVQSHDTVLFEEHVDLDSIYSKGIDDLIKFGLKGKSEIGVDPFAATIIRAVKPTVVQAMKDATLESVKKEKVRPAENASGQKAQPVSLQKAQLTDGQPAKKKNKTADRIPMVKKLKERLDISNLKFKDVTVKQKGNGTADVTILTHEVKADKDFNLDLRMEQMDSGKWKVTEITNFIEFLTDVEKETKKAVKDSVRESL